MLGQNARQSIDPAGEDDVAVNFIVRPEFFPGRYPFSARRRRRCGALW